VIEVDTVRFDEFSASGGSFGATSSGSGAPPTFGIAGGIADAVVIAGTRYDVEKVGTFGVLHVDSATGAYLYVPNNDAINALKAPSTDSFVITASDGQASASQTFSIAINGTDDAAVVTGATTGAVAAVPTAGHAASSVDPAADVASTFSTSTAAASAAAATDHASSDHAVPDNAAPTVTGVLGATDVDDPANTFAAVSSARASDHGYGSFTITADGHWTYTLDPANPDVLALTSSQTATDSFTVTTIGGTPQVVTVTIQGADDPSVIAGDTHGAVVEAGGYHGCEPGIPVACGTLTATDVDGPDDTFQAVTCPQPSDHGYGGFTMSADGHWTYALDNDNCAVQALNVGESLTDSFTVKASDGTEQTVTVAIEGSNDAAIVCGDTHACLVEPRDPCGPPPSASGTLTDRDVDDPDDTFAATACPEASEHGYGTFTMTACGTWTYTLDPANPAVEALRSCDTLTDCFTVRTIDGTSQIVTVTIQGAGGDQTFRFTDTQSQPPQPPAFHQEDPSPGPQFDPGAWHFVGHEDAHHDLSAPPLGTPAPPVHHDLIV
jgi:VCBS repeat-containing protein